MRVFIGFGAVGLALFASYLPTRELSRFGSIDTVPGGRKKVEVFYLSLLKKERYKDV